MINSAISSSWAVYSAWKRHLTVYRKNFFTNIVSPITEPVVYLAAFGLGLSPLINELDYAGNKVDYFQFIAPGMVALGVLFQAYFEGAYGTFIRLRYQRTWEALLTAPMTFGDVYAAELLWATARGTIAGVLTALVAFVWGFFSFESVLASLPLILLGSVMFAAFGLYTAGVVKTIDQVNVPTFMIVVPMFVLCGTYFPRENLPAFLEWLALVLPLSPLVDLLRHDLGLVRGWLFPSLALAIWLALSLVISWKALYAKVYKTKH